MRCFGPIPHRARTIERRQAAAIIVLGLLVQAARGRRGFGWSTIRLFVGLNYLLTVLVIIPIMAFNLAGGSFWPVRITLQAVAFGMIAAGMGAAACVYLFFEYRRITGREAAEAGRRLNLLFSAGGSHRRAGAARRSRCRCRRH